MNVAVVVSSIPRSCGHRCSRKTPGFLASRNRHVTTTITRSGVKEQSMLCRPQALSASFSASLQQQRRAFHARSLQLGGSNSNGSQISSSTRRRGENLSVTGFPPQTFASMATQTLPRMPRETTGTRKRRRPKASWHRNLGTITTDSSNLSQKEEPSTTTHQDDNDEFRPPQWLRKIQRKAAADRPMDSQKAYRYLKLEKYTKDELKNRFRAIIADSEQSEALFTQQQQPAAKSSLDQEKLQSYLSETIRQEERKHDEAFFNRNHMTASSIVTDSETSITTRIDRLRTEYVEAESLQLWRFLAPLESKTNTTTITESEFVERLTDSATSIDRQRLWPLTLSMVMIGLSVGVTTPAFPFVVQNLGLTTGEYGMVVSAFALTKLLGNIPFAVLVERNGRKPYLVYSLIAISTGVGCIGIASSFEELYACRLITGLGVAGLSCAATMAVTDISTPLNRASSFAPISAGFAAGTAMGPALGGVLIDEIGTNPTFALVGGSFLMLGGINSFLLDETMKKPHRGFPWQHEALEQRKAAALSADPSTSSNTEHNNNESDPDGSIQQAFKSALGQWVPLLSEAPVRNVCIINGFYWVALAGGQMTLLPLMLTDPSGLAMTATQVGQVYMGMSCVQVLGNPLFARVVDKVGTVPGIVGGCSMISAAMWCLPACTTDFYSMAGVLGLWAAGSSLLSTSPIAHIGNTVDDSKRAQAIALLRTAGDVGFLVGASSVGMVSDWAGSMEQTMQSSAAILGTATTWYVARNLLTAKLREETKEPKE